MRNRRRVVALSCLAALGSILGLAFDSALAGETVPFSQAAFEAAQTSGKPILIEVSAPWCPICKTQKPILAKLAAEPRFKNLQIFDIDFDTQKSLLKRLQGRNRIRTVGRRDAARMDRRAGRENALTGAFMPVRLFA
jgi:thioredoxin 1